MTHEEIIELLSCMVKKLDDKQEYGMGDVTSDIVYSLKKEWGLEN